MSEKYIANLGLKDILSLLEKLFEKKFIDERLSDIQLFVLQESLQSQTYKQIAQKAGYEYDYIKQISSRLWKLLSLATGETVSKANIQSVLLRSQQVQYPEDSRGGPPDPSPRIKLQTIDWGESPNTAFFYDRKPELHQLYGWIKQDFCSLVMILGMAGIGKTTLATKLAETMQSEFDCILWRSLRHAPSFDTLVTELVPCLSAPQEVDLPHNTAQKLSFLMDYLKKNRCLIVLDNLESILCVGDLAGRYHPDYKIYDQFIRRVADETHQSCVLMTSREKPMGLAVREGGTMPVRTFHLTGVSIGAGQDILKSKGLDVSREGCEQLVNRYCGNPHALKTAAVTIQTLFSNSLQDFLSQETLLFGDIWYLLDRQFQRLCDREKTVMLTLAKNGEGTTFDQLQADIVPTLPYRVLLEVIESLKARSLIEVNSAGITQPLIVMDYMAEQLQEQTQSS